MPVELQEGCAHASGVRKSGAVCDLTYWQIGLVEQLLGTPHSKRERNFGGRGLEVIGKQPGQMAGAHSQSFRKRSDVAALERAFLDQT